MSLAEIKADLLDVMTLRVEGDEVVRGPLLGGWQNRDVSEEGQTLMSNWSGLPVVTWVDDPLAGETLQIQGGLYEQVSPVSVVAKFALLGLTALAVVSSLLAAPVWLIRAGLLKRSTPQASALRAWPLVCALVLLALPLSLAVIGVGPTSFGAWSPVCTTMLLLTSLYPVAIAVGVWRLWQLRSAYATHKRLYLRSSVVILIHLCFTIYLASYGFLFFVAWT